MSNENIEEVEGVDLVSCLLDEFDAKETSLRSYLQLITMPSFDSCFQDIRFIDLWRLYATQGVQLISDEFAEKPIETAAIIKVIVWNLQRSIHSIKQNSNAYLSEDKIFKATTYLRYFIFMCSKFVPDLIIEQQISEKELKEVEKSYVEELAKGVLPVYYRYELLKSLGIEKRIKQLAKAGDRERAIINLINCNEKTARYLFAETYKKGINPENDERFKEILSLLT